MFPPTQPPALLERSREGRADCQDQKRTWTNDGELHRMTLQLSAKPPAKTRLQALVSGRKGPRLVANSLNPSNKLRTPNEYSHASGDSYRLA